MKRLREMINNLIKNVKKTEISSTFVPYFDTCLKEEEKKYLEEIKVSPVVSDLIKMQAIKNLMNNDVVVNENKLLSVVPNKSEKSEILSDL